MSEFKGTPGPWIVRSQEIQSVGTEDKMTAMCYGIENANLIAAAPELLEALQEMVSAIKITLRVGHERIIELGGDCDSPEVMIKGHSEIARAEAAIAKALGQ